MNCNDFQEHVLSYIDGELAADEGAAAAQHAEACDDCRGRAEFEIALERRIGAALGSDAVALDVPALLARGGTDAPTPPPRGRIVPLRRMFAAAAVLLLAVQAAWFFCIPPFECSYLQAVEAAAESDAVLPERVPDRLVALEPPAELGSYRLDGEPRLVRVGYGPVDVALRARYVGDGNVLHVLWCDPHDVEPSFRRRATLAGADWWIAAENGRTIVAWMCPDTDTLCTFVGELPEDRLVAAASNLRR